MEVTIRESFAALHGLIFGGLYLLAFSGGLGAIYGLRPDWLTAEGMKQKMVMLRIWVWGMAVIAWATVLTGTYIVYPWYRAAPPEGTTDLSAFPRSLLLSDPNTAGWHTLGMEWKEHVAWIAPIAATVVAYVISVYGPRLASDPKMKRAIAWFFIIAFVIAALAGALGAFITKAAPIY